MASAAAPCRTCSVSSSPSFHPSPAPSSPTPSTSSESRKRKRDEVVAKPRPFLITPPHSEDGAPVGARSRRMFTFPMFTSLWQSLKSFAGVGSTPPDSSPGGDEVAGSPKRVRVEATEDPLKSDGRCCLSHIINLDVSSLYPQTQRRTMTQTKNQLLRQHNPYSPYNPYNPYNRKVQTKSLHLPRHTIIALV
jgi:hypothetical protein